MATRELLSPTGRLQLSVFLPFEAPDLIRYYTLTTHDLSLIRPGGGDENRLGFALQLRYLRFPSWPWKPDGDTPNAVVAFVAKQLEIGPTSLDVHAQTRDTTRREHLREID